MIGDNFPQEHVIGFYNLGHFLLILLYIVGAVILAINERRHSKQYIENVIRICGAYIIITEIIKILVAYFNGGGIAAMFPLPYCGLFIPAIILAMFKNPKVKHIGYTFIAIGGIVGGIFYIFIPNGSIDHYPIYHVKAIHGISYHFIMAYLGLTLLTTGLYKIKAKNFIYYLSFMAVATIIALINNHFFGAHSLFLNTAAGIDFLQKICDKVPFIYALGVFCAETFLAFFGMFGIYSFIVKYIKLKKPSVTLSQDAQIVENN